MKTKRTKPRSAYKVARICTEIDEETQTYTECLQVPTQIGDVEVRVPRNLLTSPRDFETTLVSKGAFGVADFKAEAAHLLASESPSIVTVTRRALWSGDCFVNRFGEYGCQGDAQHRFDNHAPGWCSPKRCGSAVAQLKALDRAISQSPVLMVTLAAALVPALSMRVGGTPVSFSIALTGESSTGKTLATRLAHSVSSRAEEADLTSFNMTLGVAGQFGSYSGSVVAFGDIKAAQAKGRDLAHLLQTFIFGVSGGDTRRRLDGASISLPQACIPIFSMEEPLSAFLFERRVPMQGGERARVLEIPIAPRNRGGIFELAPDDATELAEEVEAALCVNHGVLLEAWVKSLPRLDDLPDRVTKLRKDFDALAPTSSSLERRLLANLGWVYAAARLLITKKYMPLAEAEIGAHFRSVAAVALLALGRDDEQLRAATDTVLRHLGRRNGYPLALPATSLDAAEAADGFRREEDGVTYLHVRMNHVSQLVSRELREPVYRNLERMGVLVTNGTERTWHVSQKGLARTRYLRIDFTRLQSILREK